MGGSRAADDQALRLAASQTPIPAISLATVVAMVQYLGMAGTGRLRRFQRSDHCHSQSSVVEVVSHRC
jgi:hypothetical protein